MIKIFANKLFPLTTIVKEAKTVSGAWNKIREIRAELATLEDKGDGTLIRIEMCELPISNRLPLEIYLATNKNGKIEFKDMQKIRERVAKRMADDNAGDEEPENFPDQGEEYMDKDLALSSL